MEQPVKSSLIEEIARINELKAKLGLAVSPIFEDMPSIVISQTELNQIAENLDVTAPMKYQSHRKVIGPLIVFIKETIVNGVLGRLFRIGLGRQWALNYHIYQTAAAVVEINDRLKAIESRLAKLETTRG